MLTICSAIFEGFLGDDRVRGPEIYRKEIEHWIFGRKLSGRNGYASASQKTNVEES